jgi:hypothetical protein
LTRQQLARWFQQASIAGHLVHPRDVAGWVGWGQKRSNQVQAGALRSSDGA